MKTKILCIFLISILILSTVCCATITDPITNPGYYEPGDNTGNTKLVSIGKTLVAGIRTIGTVIAVVSLMVIGFRYMFAGVEEKANYKETMVPYIIGAVMLFAITNILQIIYDLVTEIEY